MPLHYRLHNFRAFRDTGFLGAAPITVLCGGNSSGKSTILKSILSIKQSSANRNTDFQGIFNEQPILLNGPLTRLGAWENAVNGKEVNNSISFEWNVLTNANHIPAYNVAQVPQFGYFSPFSFYGNQDEPLSYNVLLKIGGRKYDQEQYTTSISSVDILDKNYLYSMKMQCVEAVYSAAKIQVSDFQKMINAFPIINSTQATQNIRAIINDVQNVRGLSLETGEVLYETTGPFPMRFLVISFRGWRKFFDDISTAVEMARNGRSGRTPLHVKLLRKELEAFDENVSNQFFSPEIINRFPTLYSLARVVVENISAKFASPMMVIADNISTVRYLGPLRQEPKRYYEFDDTGGIDIGISGEYAVQILSLEREKYRACSRLRNVDNNGIANQPASASTLLDEVNYWFQILGLSPVEPNQLHPSLYEMEVQASDDLGLALPDVGFGVSQVLPIILECLRAQPGDVVLLEQPEIHLHPRVQSILADFFIARAVDGVKFIIESHSEYMIKRFCRRMAEGDIEDVMNMIDITFVKDTSFGESICTPIEKNEFGEILNCPKGFFDESEDMFWINASMRRRKSRFRRSSIILDKSENQK